MPTYTPLTFADAMAVDTIAELLALTPTSFPFPRIDRMFLLVRGDNYRTYSIETIIFIENDDYGFFFIENDYDFVVTHDTS